MTCIDKIVVGVDPGPVTSGVAVWDGSKVLASFDAVDSSLLVVHVPSLLERFNALQSVVAVEWMVSYGRPVGQSVFQTVFWSGFLASRVYCRFIPEPDVRVWHCHTRQVKDASVKLALTDRFGPKGTKKAPGPFYGVSGAHAWSAVALAVTAFECPKTTGEVTLPVVLCAV